MNSILMHEKNKSKVFWKIFVMITLIFMSASFFILKTDAAVTKYINYQGKLTDNTGTPVPDGAYNIIYRVYNHATNNYDNCIVGVNACLWEETKSVTTKSGLFTTSLADNTAFNDANMGNYDGATYYLAVKVVGDVEMTPRKRITGALYALNSDRLGGKLETEFADLDENETVSGLWTFSAASVDVQNDLYTDNVFVDVGGTDIDLESTATPTTSGAYAIGANDEFDNSASTNVQDVLDDLDTAITAGASLFTDGGSVTYRTDLTDDFAIGGNTLVAPFSVDESANTVRIGDTNTDSQLTMYDSGSNFGDITYTSDMWQFQGGSASFIFDATERLIIDAETTTHTDAQGIIDIDLKTDNSLVSAIDVKLKSDVGLGPGTYPFGYKAHLVPHSADDNNAARVAYYADVASDESLASGDFHSVILGYLFMADPAFNNGIQGAASVTSFSSQVTSSSSGSLTGYSAQLTETGAGVMTGYSVQGNHTGTSSSRGYYGQVNHSGTGTLYGVEMITTANAGHVGDIYGMSSIVTNDSAANGGNSMDGLIINVSNPSGSSISSFSGINLQVDASGTQSSAYGFEMSNVAGSSLDAMIRLNGSGSATSGIYMSTNMGTAIDLSNATVASADMLLSQGTEVKDLPGDRLSFNAHLVPATGDTYDIGASTYDRKWRNAYFAGTVYAGSTLQLSDAGIIDTNSNLVMYANGANYVDVQDTLYVDGFQLDGNGQVNGNLLGTGSLGAFGSPWSNAYLGPTDVASLTVTNGITATGDITFKLGAADKVNIDASTIVHGSTPAFEIDYISSGNGIVSQLDIDSQGGAAGNLYGYYSTINTSTNDSGSITAYQTFMTDNASTSANFTGYRVNSTKHNQGTNRGFMSDLSHSGSANIENRWERAHHTGTGDLYGSYEQYRHSGSGDIYGGRVFVQHDTTAAPGAEMYGMDMFIWNTAQIQNAYGINLDLDLTSTPTSNAIGINIDTPFGNPIDTFLDINGTGQFGIDMNGATFSSGDIRLRNGAMIQGLAPNLITFSNGINLGNTANITAGNMRWSGADFEGYDGSSWRSLTASPGAPLFTSADVSGTTLTYLFDNTSDFAVGGASLNAPFSVDESLNTIRIGDTNSNSKIVMYDSGGASGDIIFASNQFEFSGNLLPASGDWYDIGSSPDARWKDAYFSGTVYAGSGTLQLSDSGIIDTNSDLVLGSTTGVIELQGNTEFTLGATDRIVIDAETTTHTDAQGIIDIDLRTDSSFVSAIDVKLKSDTGLPSGNYPFGYKAHMVPHAGDSTGALRIAYYADVASDEAVASGDFQAGMIGYYFVADPSFNNDIKGNTDASGFSAQITGSGSGTLSGFSANVTHSGNDDATGVASSVLHSGNDATRSIFARARHSGTGQVDGVSLQVEGLAGHDGLINGYYTQVTNSSAANGSNDMYGFIMDVNNTVGNSIEDVVGMSVSLDLDGTHSTAKGMFLGLNDGQADSMLEMRTTGSGHATYGMLMWASADTGIDMQLSDFATADIILSKGTFLKDYPSKNLQINATIFPDSNGAYNFGSADARWFMGYFQNGDFSSSISTGLLKVGGATGASYSRFGGGNTNQGLNASNDVYISGELEVDGAAYFDGGHTDVAENIIITENGVDKQVQYIEEDGIEKTDLAGSIIIADPNHPNKGTLTSVAYDKRVVGIIATKPSMIISGGIGREYGYPVVLAGRIKTNICIDNGSIDIGDFITSSSRPGFGMKATEPGMVVGQALESFSGNEGECGQILVFQNIGWYHNAEGFVSNAVTFGLENVEGGDFSQIDTNIPQSGDLHLTGKLLGYNNNWSIDENGMFTVHETLADGTALDLYALMSVNKEITISGQAQLENGEVEVTFENDFDQFIDENYKVLVTPTGECNGLYVFDKTTTGFMVKELDNGNSDTTFDWLVVAQRTGFVSPDPIIDLTSDNSNTTTNNNSSGNLNNNPDFLDSSDSLDNTSDSFDTDSSYIDDSSDTDTSDTDSTDSDDSGNDANDNASDTSSDTADSSTSDASDSADGDSSSNSDASSTSDAGTADSGSSAGDSSDSSTSSNTGNSADSGSTQ